MEVAQLARHDGRVDKYLAQIMKNTISDSKIEALLFIYKKSLRVEIVLDCTWSILIVASSVDFNLNGASSTI